MFCFCFFCFGIKIITDNETVFSFSGVDKKINRIGSKFVSPSSSGNAAKTISEFGSNSQSLK